MSKKNPTELYSLPDFALADLNCRGCYMQIWYFLSSLH